MSVQVLVITIDNHKSIRMSIRRSINTYISIDVSIHTDISSSNSVSMNTNINILICIRRCVCIHIIPDYMKNTNILIHECVKNVCVF